MQLLFRIFLLSWTLLQQLNYSLKVSNIFNFEIKRIFSFTRLIEFNEFFFNLIIFIQVTIIILL